VAEPDLDALAVAWTARRSPFTAALGIVIDALAPGSARMRMPVTPMLLNEGDVVHGGALASLCDVSFFVALLTVFGPNARAVTIDLAVNFLAPAPAENDVIAEARAIKTGRTISYGDVTVRSGERIVAHAVLNFLSPNPR
jgi:uncharacterized protein (TIGR00369 family)